MTLTETRQLARELVKAELRSNGVLPGTVNGSFAFHTLGYLVAMNNVEPAVVRWYDNISANQRILFQREWV